MAIFIVPFIVLQLLMIHESDLFGILLVAWVVAGILFNSHREKYCNKYCSDTAYTDKFYPDSKGYFIRQMERDSEADKNGISRLANEILDIKNNMENLEEEYFLNEVDKLIIKKYPNLSNKNKNKLIREIKNKYLE